MSSVLSNLFGAFDFLDKPDLAFGVAQYVVLEVLVSRIFRFLLKEPAPWATDFFVHVISIPFLGGLSAWTEESEVFEDSDFLTLLVDGAKGIPAVFVAQYVLQSFSIGPSLPQFHLKDVLITSASKAITRPIAGFLYKNVFGEQLREMWDDVDMLIAYQQDRSSVKGERVH